MKKLLLCSLWLIVAISSVARASEGWLTSLEDAMKKAKAEGKDILVDFNGSDW
jgi:hypothetical protein